MDRKTYLKQKREERKLTHKRVEIQLSISEYRRFETIAKREGVKVNTVVKNMAVAYRDNHYFIPAELQDALRQLTLLIRNVSNNLNQLAHSANIFRDMDARLVFEHLATMERSVEDFVKGKLKP